MTAWRWVHLVATLLAISWMCQETSGQLKKQIEDDIASGICQRKYFRNDPSSLEDALRGCKVIEGSLQIALITPQSSLSWSNLSFPELREITGYFLLFDTRKLTTLRNLFPNLAVIRGLELIDTHALIIQGNELQEIGLPALHKIEGGGVWISENPQLCYVDTVDWTRISNLSSPDGITRNKPHEQCPNTCKSNCPTSDYSSEKRCWGSQDCQRIFEHLCPLCGGEPCTDHGECCSRQCLGGCTGPSPRDCYVCKHVVFNGTCTEECPSGFYEYLKRRCVTRDECLNIESIPDVSKERTRHPLRGKLYEKDEGGRKRKMCVLECPKDTELATNKTACVPCNGPCKKNCPGTQVDSVEKARELAGCTRITGKLKISIRRGSSTTTESIVKELKENLDKIEEIDHSLVVTNTYAIFSLDFLENLKVIRGQELEDNRYALVVRSNENLMELWDSLPNRKILIENKQARVLFHYNSKLCPQKIWDFVTQSGIKQPKDDKINIGITNGDKVACNTLTLNVEIEKKTNNSVLIRYENFRRNLTLTSHLLSYEIHYREAPDYPRRNVSKYEDRDPCGADDWTVLEYPKISDADVRGGMQNEPVWEHSRLIVNLKHYAWYALYVKTIVIPDENSLNNNTGAESDIIYFQTLPGVPTKPQDFTLVASGPTAITLQWTPPAHPNGVLEKFVVWLQEYKEDQSLQDQRDYCKAGRTSPKVIATAKSTPRPFEIFGGETTTISVKNPDKDCCSCSASPIPAGKKLPDIEKIHYYDQILNQIIDRVFIPNMDSSLDLSGRDDDSNNNIRVRKKRSLERLVKRAIDDSSSDNTSGEKNNYIEFPYGEENSPGRDQPRVPTGMKKWMDVRVKKGQSKYTLPLENLTHFTTYYVGIQACRANVHVDSNSTDIENETRTCSDLAQNRIQTRPSPTADNIDPRTISMNVTDGNMLQLTWGEPLHPNGVVMAYIVKVQRWENSRVVDLPKEKCITRKDFQAKRNFTFPYPLHPGNYSVSIRVASLAMDSEFTQAKWIIIEDSESGMSGVWALIILLPLFLMIIIASLLGYYYIRQKGIIDRRIVSANPEYMSNVDIPEEWEVPREKLIISERELGKGSFGEVYEGILRDFIRGAPNIRCAVKTVAEDASSEQKALFLMEAALMVKLDCRCNHVVKLLGVISKTQPTCVIMELMTRGDLKNYLRSRRPGPDNGGEPPPTLRQILRMAAEIADGMAYLHKNKLVHRDLAARNCMVAENMTVKVGDFGMTKEVQQADYYRKQTRGLLPVRWMAPESLRDGVFTNQSDVWSFGVVLWEMATLASQPYQGLSNSQVLEYVLGHNTMERPENCPDILFHMMTICWQFEPRDRPSFVQIIEEKLLFDLDESFAQVSFYHSPEGQAYREKLRLQPREDAFFQVKFDQLTPLATIDDDDDDLDDSDDDVNDFDHQIVDDLGETPSRLLISNPTPSSVPMITSSRTPSSLLNGLALNPLVIHNSPTNNSESINLANHALPAPTSSSFSSSSTATPANNPYSAASSRNNNNNNNSSVNYSPRPRTNSNNNNTNPRLPNSLNLQNSLGSANLNRGGGGSGLSGVSVHGTTQAGGGSSSSISSANFSSLIPNGIVDPSMNFPYHHSASGPGVLSSPNKCSSVVQPLLQNSSSNSGDSAKLEQSSIPNNAYSSSGYGSSDRDHDLDLDHSQALLINHSGSGPEAKLINGGGAATGGGGGNGYIKKRRGSPLDENQPVNRTTQC